MVMVAAFWVSAAKLAAELAVVPAAISLAESARATALACMPGSWPPRCPFMAFMPPLFMAARAEAGVSVRLPAIRDRLIIDVSAIFFIECFIVFSS